MKTFFSSLLIVFVTIFVAPAFSANLPSGYTELEYIQSTGGQYVDTGVARGSSNFVVEYDINMVTANGARFAFSGASWNVSSYLAFDKSDNTFDVGQGTTESVQGALNTRYKLKAEYKVGSIVLSLYDNNGTLLASATRTNDSWVSSNTDSWLFGTVRDIPSGTSFSYTLKSFGGKIWQGTTLVRDFVPAKNSSGVIGMYDTVSGNFFTNKGTGTFTGGPVVLDSCRNLFDKDAMIHGAYVGESGTETVSARFCYSNYIPVTPGQTYTFSAVRNLSAANKRIHAYDSNKNWIQQLGLSPSSSSDGPYAITVTIPSGISYILISGMICDVDGADTNMQLEQGSTATAYVPYNASCHNPNPIKIATTAYNAARFSQVKTDLNSAVATIREIVTKTINQTAAIASLQADKQTRPEDACPAGKKCLLVETEENGVVVPHWFPIVENIYGLPAGYTALEYIQSDGNSWIDTGIKGNMSYKYDIEFQQLDAGQYRNWGAFNQETFNGGPNMSLTYAGDGFLVRWTVSGNGQQYVNGLSSFDTNRHHLVIDNGNITWDGVSKGRSTGHRDNYQLNYNLFLGTINPGGTIPTSNAKSKYYSYKVWNTDGNLIQNFVPAKNSSGVVGMYDTVNDRFYTNAGTGTFTAGPEI